ncbi:MAG: HAD family hydrolase [Chloroherpetonaceae bacterium]|nr:HAD family hydrolase [Chloroherpetonaceae bacterium]
MLNGKKAIIFSLDSLTKRKVECEGIHQLFSSIEVDHFQLLGDELSLREIQQVLRTIVIVFNACVEQTIHQNFASPSLPVITERALELTLKRKVSAAETEEVLDAIISSLGIHVTKKMQLYLNLLQQSGYLLGIVANLPFSSGVLTTVLGNAGLHKQFETIITSTDSGIFKPNPEIYQMAIESMSCTEAEVFVVGSDIERDILPLVSSPSKKIYLNSRKKSASLPEGVSFIHSLEDLREIV